MPSFATAGAEQGRTVLELWSLEEMRPVGPSAPSRHGRPSRAGVLPPVALAVRRDRRREGAGRRAGSSTLGPRRRDALPGGEVELDPDEKDYVRIATRSLTSTGSPAGVRSSPCRWPGSGAQRSSASHDASSDRWVAAFYSPTVLRPYSALRRLGLTTGKLSKLGEPNWSQGTFERRRVSSRRPPLRLGPVGPFGADPVCDPSCGT